MGMKEAVKAMLEAAGKMVALKEKTGISRQTYHEILTDKQKDGPRFSNIMQMANSGVIDKHEFAHYVFDLDPPEEIMEVEGTLKEIHDLLMQMNEDERLMLKSMIEYHMKGRIIGGGNEDETGTQEAGFG
ncbi:MAG: hypothetical protein SWK76_17180 [Actinomycetota bacterium]|nr:hypothetical protein [Actinomycetota bacterium]